ncbi:hypothetical protein DSL92_07185 [Billgrantia gudaonensis]|uniref:Uncharacterized protein n=1 Tax=Billgrantia gudaonensis TaxID=376427 RepID=A0A3S0NWQ5_9GAMM|nr:hypothetical protein DSL92_07185 [Halomonas gudaonensis]
MSQYEPLRRRVDDNDVPKPQPGSLLAGHAAAGADPMPSIAGGGPTAAGVSFGSALPAAAHDDHILEDMGHCRDDILWALRLPLRWMPCMPLRNGRPSPGKCQPPG